MWRSSISAIAASPRGLEWTPVHAGGRKPEMRENGRRDVDDAGRLLPRHAMAEARAVDHQKGCLLACTEATVLAAAEDICLATGTLRDEAGAGHAIGIGLLARTHGDGKSEAVIPALPHRRQCAAIENSFRPFLIGEEVANQRRARHEIGMDIKQ